MKDEVKPYVLLRSGSIHELCKKITDGGFEIMEFDFSGSLFGSIVREGGKGFVVYTQSMEEINELGGVIEKAIFNGGNAPMYIVRYDVDIHAEKSKAREARLKKIKDDEIKAIKDAKKKEIEAKKEALEKELEEL